MKRFLTIALCVMMVASLFAINVSAAIPTAEVVMEGAAPEVVYLNQDFSNTAAKADFTVKNYDGEVSVDASGVMHMTGAYKTGRSMDTTAGPATVISSSSYVYEFDFCRTGEVPADYKMFATFKRAANAESSNADLKKYGVVIPISTSHITKGTWYTYRITVTEDAYAASSDLSKLMKVEYKEKTADAWTNLSHAGSWNFVGKTNVCRIVTGGNALDWTNPATEIHIGVTEDTYGNKFDENTMDGRTEDFAFDNIKVYTPAFAGTPVSTPYPIKKGIVYTDSAETTKTSAGSTVYYDKTIGWTAEPSRFVTTFDAVTTVAGGPISVSTAGLNARSAMATIKPATIGQWYNYKIVYSSDGANASIDAVYRKAEGTSAWTLLSKAPSKTETDGYDWWDGYNGSGSFNRVRWYLYGGLSGSNVSSNCESGTSWTVKNIQVTDGSAFTGKTAVADGNMTVTLNTELYSAADVIVAVYDGAALKDVKYAPVAITGNTATVTVPYAAGNTVKLYAWDGIATGVPVLTAPITISE